MLVPADKLSTLLADLFSEEYDNATVYADADSDTVLHDGKIYIRPNGWLKLPSGRLVSPTTIHHIDTHTPTE